MPQIVTSESTIPSHRNAHILPERMYSGIAPETVRWTERHLAQVMKLKPDGLRYVTRMKECRPSRPCNLHACPQCWKRQEVRRVAAFNAAVEVHPIDAILTLDALLEPRDRLIDQDNSPLIDTRRIRKILKAAFADVRGPGSQLLFSGRYEFESKRSGTTAFLREHAERTTMSRVVVPHIHAVALAQIDGHYPSPAEIRKRLQAHFPGNRQIKVGRLHGDKPRPDALDAAVGYAFKGHTAGLSGRLLRDYITTQMTIRKDAWVISSRSSMPSPSPRTPMAI